MSPLQVSKKSIRGLVPLFRKLLTKVHMHPLHQVAFERVIEIGVYHFQGFEATVDSAGHTGRRR